MCVFVSVCICACMHVFVCITKTLNLLITCGISLLGGIVEVVEINEISKRNIKKIFKAWTLRNVYT